MLLPLRIENYPKFNYKYNISKNNTKPETGKTTGNLKSIYNCSAINFRHYMGFKSNDIANNPSYFKLPQITLQDGTIHQFTPDKSQIECAQKLLQGDSVLYCAPTGTGKTAVAHFAINKNLDENKKTIVTVPLVALANDKYREFSKIYGIDNVGILTGDRKVNTNAPIVIMTTEILYNQSNDLKNNNNIGTIIFDEAHYLSDEQRGNVWENSIIASVPNDIQVLCLSATIGNSEEFSNWLNSLNKAQNSSLVEIKPKERYVPLVWELYNPMSSELFSPIIQYDISLDTLNLDSMDDKQKRAIGRIYQIQNDKNEFYIPKDSEIQEILSSLKDNLKAQYRTTEEFEQDFLGNYPQFSKENAKEISNLLRNEDNKYIKNTYAQYMPNNNLSPLIDDLKKEDKLPALIFKFSRNRCDDIIKDLYLEKLDLTTEKEKKEIEKIIDDYSKSGYLGKDINKEALLNGYGAHHAGKLPQYRKLIEELFSKKLLKVVVATSTLSAGINMPARSVVISDMTYKAFDYEKNKMETTPVSVNEFHQMAGRAGRRGIDNIGYVILYNLKSIPKEFSKEEYNKDKIDELDLAYNYISSKPDNIRSQYRPDPVLIANYYNNNESNIALRDLINKSFKIYSAKDKNKVSDSEIKKFENYSHILLKQGFAYKDYKNQYVLTPKGKLLLNAQGANPLMTVGLIYDGILNDISPINLAQIAGYISDSSEQQEVDDMLDTVEIMLKNSLDSNCEQEIKKFKKVRKMYLDREEKLLKTVKESKVDNRDILKSDNLSGYISYLWAKYNSWNQNSIENFENISEIKFETQNPDIKRSLEAKLSQGNIYRTISHTISVLKQIERICDCALNDSDNYPDIEYYEQLKLSAQKAIELMDKEPIKIEDTL